jgi:hypothetical protein
VALPVDNATAGIALRIIWPHKPSHLALAFNKVAIPWRGPYSISRVIMMTEAAGFHSVAAIIQQATRPHILAGYILLPCWMLHCVGVRPTVPDISNNCCAFVYRVKSSKKRGGKNFYLTEIIIILSLHTVT